MRPTFAKLAHLLVLFLFPLALACSPPETAPEPGDESGAITSEDFESGAPTALQEGEGTAAEGEDEGEEEPGEEAEEQPPQG